jgi:dTDP-4-amino-4,6-dideoxygalactose transaminase
VSTGSRHAWQSFVCFVDPTLAPLTRNEIMAILHAKGIATRPGTHAIHKLGIYQNKFGYKAKDFPKADLCDEQTMAIPLHNRMTPEDYEYVVETLKSV